ncbi:hypothetical protein [Streptomyces sp. NPDC001635]
MATKTAWDAPATAYQAGLLLAALTDTQHRIPRDAKSRTLDIMHKRQWIRPSRRTGTLASVESGAKDFVLTHHGVNAANRAKAMREAAEAQQTPELPQTTIKDSSELAEGDIVREHGMRVRLDKLTTVERPGCTVYHWAGTVLNVDEVREAKRVPMSFLRTEKWEAGKGWVTDRDDYWAVQGNKLATWAVEVPTDALVLA